MTYSLIIRGKAKTFTTIEEIERTLGVTVDDVARQVLDAASLKGETLHVAPNPYQAEMATGDDKISIILAQTKADLDDLYYALLDEI